MPYCKKCGDKLELIEVVQTIKKFSGGGLFSYGHIDWEKQPLAYCDNVNCDLYGVIVVKGLTSEARGELLAAPQQSSSPDGSAKLSSKAQKDGDANS